MNTDPNTGRGSTSNVIAALASFFIPGLGQLIQGRVLAALGMFLFSLLLFCRANHSRHCLCLLLRCRIHCGLLFPIFMLVRITFFPHAALFELGLSRYPALPVVLEGCPPLVAPPQERNSSYRACGNPRDKIAGAAARRQCQSNHQHTGKTRFDYQPLRDGIHGALPHTADTSPAGRSAAASTLGLNIGHTSSSCSRMDGQARVRRVR